MIKFKSFQTPTSKIGTEEKELKYVLQLVSPGTVSSKHVVEFACKHTTLQPTTVKAALESCFQIIEHYLSLGYRVQLGELGTFYPTINYKRVDSNTKAGLAQLEKINIRFRPNSELIESVNKSEKELVGIFKLADAEKKYYDEVGTGNLNDSGESPESGDNTSQGDSGNNNGGGFAG